jgi:hypothetical protein
MARSEGTSSVAPHPQTTWRPAWLTSISNFSPHRSQGNRYFIELGSEQHAWSQIRFSQRQEVTYLTKSHRVAP